MQSFSKNKREFILMIQVDSQHIRKTQQLTTLQFNRKEIDIYH